MLRELANALARPVFVRSWKSREVAHDWKTASVAPIFKKRAKNIKLGIFKMVSLNLVPTKIMEQVLLERTSGHSKMMTTWKCQHKFVMGKPGLTNLIFMIK